MGFEELKEIIENDDAKSLRAALEGDANLVKGIFEGGHSLLTLAASQIRKEVPGIGANVDVIYRTKCLKLLIESGAEIDHQDGTGASALLHAASDTSLEAIKMLLNAGADPALEDEYGINALMSTLTKGWFSDATRACIELLLFDSRVDINTIGRNLGGRAVTTALMEAADAGDTAAVKFLLDKGADIEVANDDGDTAFVMACISERSRMERKEECVRFFISKGVNIERIDHEGKTPLMRAVGEGVTEVVEILLNAGANVNVQDDQGETALFLAISNNPEIFRLILDATPDAGIDHQNLSGRTPLMEAAAWGCERYMGDLIFAGADVNHVMAVASQPLCSVLSSVIMSSQISDDDLQKAVRLLISSGAKYSSELARVETELASVDAGVVSAWINKLGGVAALLKKARLIDEDAVLSDDAKKLVKAISFSSSWSKDEEFHDCVKMVRPKVLNFLADDKINDEIKEFILDRFVYLGTVFAKGCEDLNFSEMSSMEILINLFFFHGNRIEGATDLLWMEEDLLKKFAMTMPEVRQCSVGEFLNWGVFDMFVKKANDEPRSPFAVLTKPALLKIASFLGLDDDEQSDEDADVKEDGASYVEDDEFEVESEALGKRGEASYDGKREEGADKRSRGAAEESDGYTTEESLDDDNPLYFLLQMSNEEIDRIFATGDFNLADLNVGQVSLGFFADGFQVPQEVTAHLLGGNGSSSDMGNASESDHGSMSDVD